MVFSAVACLLVTLVASPSALAQFPSLLFACPARGCSSRSTHALPSPVPETTPTIRWNWTEPGITYGDPDFQSRGCSSSSSTVTCPTQQGHVNLKVKTGKQHWFTKVTNATPSYLPIVDMYGNVVQNDNMTLTFVEGQRKTVDGQVDIRKYQTKYGAVQTYSQTILITSSRNDTPQLLTYSIFGDALATTTLKGTALGVKGTFIPCGQPLVDYERAYVATMFIPDNDTDPTARFAKYSKRLYAIDISGNAAADSNVVAWHIDLATRPDDVNMDSGENRASRSGTSGESGESRSSGKSGDPFYDFDMRMSFFNNTVYLNYRALSAYLPEGSWDKSKTKRQPPPPSNYLVAVRDKPMTSTNRTTPTLLFQKYNTPVGPIGIFDHSDMLANFTATGPRPLWITQPYNWRTFTALDPTNGTVLVKISLSDVTKASNLSQVYGDITTDISIARQPNHPDRDVLVFGTVNDDGQAHVVAMEAGLPPMEPKIMWTVNVSGPRRAPGRVSQWTIGGQIASVILPAKGGTELKYGLVVSVVEGLGWVNANEVYVRMLM